jgi:hypothetical protein
MWTKKKEEGNEQCHQPLRPLSTSSTYFFHHLYAPELQYIAPFSFKP